MTRGEAILKLFQAIEAAIKNDDVVDDALGELADHGVSLHAINVNLIVNAHANDPASLPAHEPANPIKDEDFLRQLRIHPDIEVREK